MLIHRNPNYSPDTTKLIYSLISLMGPQKGTLLLGHWRQHPEIVAITRYIKYKIWSQAWVSQHSKNHITSIPRGFFQNVSGFYICDFAHSIYPGSGRSVSREKGGELCMWWCLRFGLCEHFPIPAFTYNINIITQNQNAHILFLNVHDKQFIFFFSTSLNLQ